MVRIKQRYLMLKVDCKDNSSSLTISGLNTAYRKKLMTQFGTFGLGVSMGYKGKERNNNKSEKENK
jgi:hypothetical protein